MTEETCRHCEATKADHRADRCPVYYEPGPTYAVLQERLRVAREALGRLEHGCVALAICEEDNVLTAKSLTEMAELAKAVMKATEETDG